MSLAQITVQLYSLRDALEVDFESTIRKLAAIGYPGEELAGLHDCKPAEGEHD